MNRILFVFSLAIAATVVSADSASAQGPGSYSFLPFGFYQPYGSYYGNSIRNPPYFTSNPPVYYGARHARPYGLSPFASPPLVRAADDYESRLRMQFQQPQIPTPGPYSESVPCNSCLGGAPSAQVLVARVGAIRTNPFVEPSEMVAKN